MHIVCVYYKYVYPYTPSPPSQRTRVARAGPSARGRDVSGGWRRRRWRLRRTFRRRRKSLARRCPDRKCCNAHTARRNVGARARVCFYTRRRPLTRAGTQQFTYTYGSRDKHSIACGILVHAAAARTAVVVRDSLASRSSDVQQLRLTAQMFTNNIFSSLPTAG